MSTMSSPAQKRWYPNLKGIADPSKAFEVQTAESMHQVMDYVYDINDRMGKMAPPAAPPQAAAAKSSWWNTPYAVDGFSGNAAATAITINWGTYRIAPVALQNRKTPYVNVPPGSLTASGLASATKYWFYPAFDTGSNKVVFVVDPHLVVGSTKAHTGPSSVALVKSSSGDYVPLTTNGLAVTTGAGAFSGQGSGLVMGFTK